MTKPDLTADQALGVALSVQSPSMRMDEAQAAAPSMSDHLRQMGYQIDPLRPATTDAEPVVYLEPLMSDRPAAVIGYLFAAASGFIVGVLIMWAAR